DGDARGGRGLSLRGRLLRLRAVAQVRQPESAVRQGRRRPSPDGAAGPCGWTEVTHASYAMPYSACSRSRHGARWPLYPAGPDRDRTGRRWLDLGRFAPRTPHVLASRLRSGAVVGSVATGEGVPDPARPG